MLEMEGRPKPRCVRGLVLAPTRELANQIMENLRGFCEGTPLKAMMVVGGQSINPQIKRLERGVDLLVATPGRLLDLMDRRAVMLHETTIWCWTKAIRCWTWALSMTCARLPA